VIAGHVDSTAGPAVFFSLRDLRRGDAVLVVDRRGTVHHFVVDGVRSYPKDRFPTASVYGPQPLPVLRLITCTGAFDEAARSYVDNLVVSAHLA
jgi:sortase (surface protein transpeptidase)